ncbi:MAG: PEP/pyruvate-binding domain-containing protein, partial [Desulfosalsimonas sp.]
MPAKPRESAAGQLPLTRGQQIRSHIKHTLENWFLQTAFPGLLIRKKYAAFQRLRQGDRSALELISRLEEIRQKRLVCDCEHIRHLCDLLDLEIQELLDALIAFNPVKYALLRNYHRKYAFYVNLALMEEPPGTAPPYVLSLASELSEDRVGGKAATLSVLHSRHDLPIPPGLAVTTGAFALLLEKNRLLPAIQKELARLGPDNHEAIPEISRIIRDWIMQAEMPKALETEVSEALKQHAMADIPLALRSSAVGEDLQASFAGQFESRLNVSPKNWVDAYKAVLASKYSPHAIYYRMSQGFTDLMTPMAVLIMPTIRAAVSGILYTRDPNRPEQAALYMVSGSGEKLADGETCQAQAEFDTRRGRLQDPGPSCPLPRQTLTELFRFGQTLEDIFGTPQDVEWVVDQDGQIRIVQSRPLRMSEQQPEPAAADYPDAEILARGQWVSSGQASGPVHLLRDPGLAAQVPAGAVLVTGELPPELTLALSRV